MKKRNIIYRKTDLICLGTSEIGTNIEDEINLNVIPNFGGNIDDFGMIETDLVHFELIKESDIVKVIEKTPEPVAPDTNLEEILELRIAQNTVETLELISALNELQRLEQAQSNTELIELMMSLQGGM